MEKDLFMALGLHLYPVNQLELILNITCDIEFLLLLLILKIRRYFVQPSDFILLIIGTFIVVHTMFRIEFLTFFSVIYWFQSFVFAIYLVYKRYRFPKRKK